MIGTVVSLFTAVLATRAMLGLLGGLALFDKDDFMGVVGVGAGPRPASLRRLSPK